MVHVRVATAARCQLLLYAVSFGTHYLFTMTPTRGGGGWKGFGGLGGAISGNSCQRRWLDSFAGKRSETRMYNSKLGYGLAFASSLSSISISIAMACCALIMRSVAEMLL